MTFSFDPALPSAKDRIRLILGDFTAPGLRQDETLNAAITAHGEAEATARLAEGLAAEFAQRPDSIGGDGQSISWRDRVKTWLEVASRMRATGVAAATALSVSVAATRGDEAFAEYRRPESWVWGD